MSPPAIPAQAKDILATATKRSSRQFREGWRTPGRKGPARWRLRLLDLGAKHSLNSRSISNWVSISVLDFVWGKVESGRHSRARDISRVSSVAIDGSGKGPRIEA